VGGFRTHVGAFGTVPLAHSSSSSQGAGCRSSGQWQEG
jgi:hypothetical protein